MNWYATPYFIKIGSNLQLNIIKLSQLPMLKVKLLTFFIIFTFFIFAGNVYGQNSNGITTSTNKASYHLGDKVTVTGSVQQIMNGNPATIIVRNPIGNVYAVGQATLVGTMFEYDFVISNDSQSGVYTIDTKYGTQTGEIQFTISASQVQTIPVFNNVITVRGDNTTLIKYGNVQVSSVHDSITIPIDTSKISSGYVIEEYQIPKQVIDAPDGQLLIKEDGSIAECSQTETNAQRVIDCPVQAGAKQLVFIGTEVIPEFGSLPVVVFIISILGSLIAFTKYKIKP